MMTEILNISTDKMEFLSVIFKVTKDNRQSFERTGIFYAVISLLYLVVREWSDPRSPTLQQTSKQVFPYHFQGYGK